MNDHVWIEGIDFIEFSASNRYHRLALANQFSALGFVPVAYHRTLDTIIYRQNNIHFIINCAENSLSLQYADMHGPSISAIGFRVADASIAYQHALNYAALPCDFYGVQNVYELPAIYSIGNSLIYFVDYKSGEPSYARHFLKSPYLNPEGIGSIGIDHMTYLVSHGSVDEWADSYVRLFNFKKGLSFCHENQLSKSLQTIESPDGKFFITFKTRPVDIFYQNNFRREYDGIEHIALAVPSIPKSIKLLSLYGIECFSSANHQSSIKKCDPPKRKLKEENGKDSLQIFTPNLIESIFFELIQRNNQVGADAKETEAWMTSLKTPEKKRLTENGTKEKNKV